MARDPILRIGELSRRSGVSTELLRAWERRYGLLRPVRSAGGLRLYSTDDLERVRLMRRHLDAGLAAAEAAGQATRDAPVGEPEALPAASATALDAGAARAELAAAVDAFDEGAVQASIDRFLSAGTVDAFLADVLLPYLRELGERWAQGEATVAQEHYASALIRGRLLGLARGWGAGVGPVAVLACLPGEYHEFGLIAFGLALRSRGWRIAYLGADTPLETVDQTAETLEAQLVALSSVSPARAQEVRADLERLAQRHRVGLGGDAAARLDRGGLGVVILAGDPIGEAERATARLAAGAP